MVIPKEVTRGISKSSCLGLEMTQAYKQEGVGVPDRSHPWGCQKCRGEHPSLQREAMTCSRLPLPGATVVWDSLNDKSLPPKGIWGSEME